jgi:hypothetical protein
MHIAQVKTDSTIFQYINGINCPYFSVKKVGFLTIIVDPESTSSKGFGSMILNKSEILPEKNYFPCGKQKRCAAI